VERRKSFRASIGTWSWSALGNMRAASIHKRADATVSVLIIVGLSGGRYLGLAFMDPVAGLIGVVVTVAWA
jgi:divalent metal cation (Fe/Co/Zn/Cd) transporter